MLFTKCIYVPTLNQIDLAYWLTHNLKGNNSYKNVYNFGIKSEMYKVK
jgi:hypothetical protein